MSKREQIFQSILNTGFLTCVCFDSSGVITEAYPDVSLLSDQKHRDLLGKNIFELFPRLSIESELPQQISFKSESFSAVVVKSDDSDSCLVIHKFTKTAADLKAESERLEVERALVQSEERYRTIYESTVTAMGVLGPEGLVVSANSKVVELTGYSHDEVIGRMSWVDFVHPDDIQSVAQQRKSRLLGDESSHQEYEFRLIRKDGSIRFILMRTGTIPNSNGMAIISLADVTAQVEYQKQLRLSLSETQAILEAIPDLVFVLSKEGKYLDFHTAERVDLTLTTDELSDTGYSDIAFPGVSAAEVLTAIDQTLNSLKIQSIEYSLELPDGVHYYEAGMAPFNKESVIVICRDVTVRKSAETEQLRLLSQVQHVQKLESLGVLAGGIAHDFNNILMAISGNAQLAKSICDSKSPISGYLDSIEKATSRASDLATQMLAYSGKGDFEISSLDINSVVDDISDMLSVTVSKKAEVSFDLRDDLPPILADATQIRQVFMNLVTNASEALEDQSGTIRVSTGVVYCDDKYINSLDRLNELSPGNYAFIKVEDSGVGMSPEVRKSIFNPFFSTKFTGRGLGLSAVLGIMNSHKGALEISSVPGEGSSFKALFPIMEGETAAVSETNAVYGMPRKLEGTVMFVDDEPLVRTVVETMLDQFGFDVIVAVDGVDCINKFESKVSEIDLVILDITMPNMDGDEAFKKIRKLRSDIPVIISSGYSEHEVISRFPDEYPDAFLQKPYNAAELQSKIVTILRK